MTLPPIRRPTSCGRRSPTTTIGARTSVASCAVEPAAGNHLTMFDPVNAPSLGPASRRFLLAVASERRQKMSRVDFRPPLDCPAGIVSAPDGWRRSSPVTADGERRRMNNGLMTPRQRS